MSEGSVSLTQQGAVATVVFDRPAARNAMTWEMYAQLREHCVTLAAQRSARVVVFRGAGGEAFVAGTDIAQFREFDAEAGIAYERQIDAGIDLVERLPMPSVAVVDGWAVGGGLAIATACDFRVATPQSRFGVPIARTLGNTLSIANVARLRAAWGVPLVKRMLLLAEMADAAEALACGFLHAVCAPDDLERTVASLCDQLIRLAPVTQEVAKEALRRLNQGGLPEADDLVRRAYGSRDFKEGVEAFVARRPPQWNGS